MKRSLPCWALPASPTDIGFPFAWSYPDPVYWLHTFGFNHAKDWLLYDGGQSEGAFGTDGDGYRPVVRQRLRQCSLGITPLDVLLTADQVQDIFEATLPVDAHSSTKASWIDADANWLYLCCRGAIDATPDTPHCVVWKVDYEGNNLAEVCDISHFQASQPVIANGSVYSSQRSGNDLELLKNGSVSYTFDTSDGVGGTWFEAAGMALAGYRILDEGDISFDPDGGGDRTLLSVGYDPFSNAAILLWSGVFVPTYVFAYLTVLTRPVTPGNIASQAGVKIYRMELANNGTIVSNSGHVGGGFHKGRNVLWMIPMIGPCAGFADEQPTADPCADRVEIDFHNDVFCSRWWWTLDDPVGCDCDARIISTDDDEVCFEITCTDGSTHELCVEWPECEVEACECINEAPAANLVFSGFPQCSYSDGTWTYEVDYAALNYAWGLSLRTVSLPCIATWRAELGVLEECWFRGRLILTQTHDTTGERYEHYAIHIDFSANGTPLGVPDDNAIRTDVTVQQFRTRAAGFPDDEICEYAGTYALTPANCSDTGVSDNQVCRGIMELERTTSSGHCSPYTVTAKVNLFYNTSL
jgi:hypothetical protein